MTLQRRVLTAKISLAQSGGTGQQTTFDDQGSNVATVTGLRMSAAIVNAGGAFDSTMDLTIYGLQRTIMNQLSTLGLQISLVPRNEIVLTAGNDDDNPSMVFTGYITTAYADFNASPDVAFHISAQCSFGQSANPAQPSSFQGSADVATIMQSLATNMGLKFENSGVQTKIMNPYLSGSYRDQMRDAAAQANINASIVNGVLAIWPKNGSRNGQIPKIAPPPDGEMIGYPFYTAYGIGFRNVYNPSIGFGQKIEMQSSVQQACGQWSIYRMDHMLESEMPGGKWESLLLGYNPKYPNPVAR